MQESASTACLMCTPEGNVFAWPELTQSGQQEPLQARISQNVTSMSDMLIVAHDRSTTGMFSVLGAADGRLYRLDCISPGTSAEAISITPLQQPEVPPCQLLVLSQLLRPGVTVPSEFTRTLPAERFDGILEPILGQTFSVSCQGSRECAASDSRWKQPTDPGAQQSVTGLLAGASEKQPNYMLLLSSSPALTYPRLCSV